jgi:hypothetical protein
MSLKLKPLVAALALSGLAFTLPAWAASSASSASSDGSSTSVGSSSTSIEKSSNSSSKGDKVAEGDYKVIQVAEATAAGKLRLTLRATHDSGEEFHLILPQEAATQGKLAVGAVITAKAHAYGLQFAAADTREPFFLVLRDDWYRELATKPVTL